MSLDPERFRAALARLAPRMSGPWYARGCTCIVDDPDVSCDVVDADCPVHGTAPRERAARIEALEWVRLTHPTDDEIATAIENLKRCPA